MRRLLSAALLSSLCCLAHAAVDVNTATVIDLDGVKGIGPAKSARILKERDKAPFRDWNDFTARVHGVGTSTAHRLSDEGVTVNGEAYVHTPAEAPAPRAARPRP